MFTHVGENDRDWDESLEGFKFCGKTQGCGCCSSYVGLTRENLEEHIRELEEKLEEARSILYSL